MELQDEIKIANEEYKQVLEQSSKTFFTSIARPIADG